MRDLIDERDFREKCARSIVKNYNVHYMTKEEVEEQQIEKAKEIVEDAKYGVIKEIVGQAEQREKAAAAADKQEEIDPVTEEQIRKILGEREEQLEETIEANKQ